VIGDIPERPQIAPGDATLAHDVVAALDGGDGDAGDDRAGMDDAAEAGTDDGATRGDATPMSDGRVGAEAAGDVLVRDSAPDTKPDPCEVDGDLDGDGYRSRQCGGEDCDDTAKLVFPGQPVFYDVPTHLGGSEFDSDCNGAPDAQYCSVGCSGLGLLCDQAASGFDGQTAPACGQTGRFGHSKVSGLGCVDQVEQLDKAMPCK